MQSGIKDPVYIFNAGSEVGGMHSEFNAEILQIPNRSPLLFFREALG